MHRELKLKFHLAYRLRPETEKLGGGRLCTPHPISVPISQLQTLTRLSSGLCTDDDQMKSPRIAAAPGAATAAISSRCLLWYSCCVHFDPAFGWQMHKTRDPPALTLRKEITFKSSLGKHLVCM